MIDFACRTFSLPEVIRCGLGLTKGDFIIFDFIIKNRNRSYSTNEISKALSVDLSTAQRSVKKLYEKGVIGRQQINLSGGGYTFNYRSKPRQEIKSLVMSIVGDWVSRVESEFDNW